MAVGMTVVDMVAVYVVDRVCYTLNRRSWSCHFQALLRDTGDLQHLFLVFPVCRHQKLFCGSSHDIGPSHTFVGNRRNGSNVLLVRVCIYLLRRVRWRVLLAFFVA